MQQKQKRFSLRLSYIRQTILLHIRSKIIKQEYINIFLYNKVSNFVEKRQSEIFVTDLISSLQ